LAVIVLDSGEDKPDSDLEYGGTAAYDAYREQLAAWLKQAIQSEDIRTAPVKIALLHVPFEKGKGWYGSNELKRLFVPILNEAGVDLMLSGHTHSYGIREKGTCDGNEFPILVNDNNSRMDVVANEKEITVKVVDALGKVTRDLKFKVE
jgi:predicted phosphodiesterase